MLAAWVLLNWSTITGWLLLLNLTDFNLNAGHTGWVLLAVAGWLLLNWSTIAGWLLLWL